jgi:hypothetical protein
MCSCVVRYELMEYAGIEENMVYIYEYTGDGP